MGIRPCIALSHACNGLISRCRKSTGNQQEINGWVDFESKLVELVVNILMLSGISVISLVEFHANITKAFYFIRSIHSIHDNFMTFTEAEAAAVYERSRQKKSGELEKATLPRAVMNL
ncbi:hypothetical protein MA16_Dca006483 [Dendrobium catenatum]|uniref:Uncharacterized protein n=1 Tax=Dendrobium catenatum TaxID=906689 RepID=A0A2I0XGP1_9ASPA|nr:hypothetical protein MA16_Dca006483 [Dendrobium catenatum]